MIPKMYTIPECAEFLQCPEDYLRAKLRDGTFAGVKIAGRWRMTEDQICAAIEASSTTVRPTDGVPPSGISRRSRASRRRRAV